LTLGKIIYAISLLCIVSLAHANEDADQKSNQQRLMAVIEHIDQTAHQEHATLVSGSVNVRVFGPDATVAFFTLLGAGGAQYQYMIFLERRIDKEAGEVAPPIEGAYIILKRYSHRHVVIGHIKIGSTNRRILDISSAVIKEDRTESIDFRLRATVTIPVVGSGAPVNFLISHRYDIEKATISELTN
jgi:hypothetical protein